LEPGGEDGEYIGYEYDDLIDWIRETGAESWPSLYECDRWLDREDRAILENGHCFIGASEYCGFVSVWIVPKESDGWGRADTSGLAAAWIERIAPRFRELFGEYEREGVMSNGCGVYRKVKA
jgi:hypothetical protein